MTIEDGGKTTTLAESGAIVEYIIEKYGNGKLGVAPSDAQKRATYLYWLHWAEGSAMLPLMFSMCASSLLFTCLS